MLIKLILVVLLAQGLYGAKCYTAAAGMQAISEYSAFISGVSADFTKSIETAHLESKVMEERLAKIRILEANIRLTRTKTYDVLKEIVFKLQTNRKIKETEATVSAEER